MSVDGSVLALGVRLAIEMLEEVIAGLDQNLFEKKEQLRDLERPVFGGGSIWFAIVSCGRKGFIFEKRFEGHKPFPSLPQVPF